jgi:excisionase family DNA binding protein
MCMNEQYASRPSLPGYVSIKEAAKILGISDKRVYEYVDEGRLSSMWAADVIMIPLDEVKQFKRRSSGRPRKSIPTWRISSGDNTQYITSIFVQIRAGQQDNLLQKLEEIRRGGQHLFPGTVARFFVKNHSIPDQIEISFIWRSGVMPNESARKQQLETFEQALIDVLDWSTAQYNYGEVLMHT